LPEYNIYMVKILDGEFRPDLLSRRGEWTAWVLFLAVCVGMIFLKRTAFIPAWAWIFWFFLFFSALSITLGNWMDRHTIIKMEINGIRYENGLRRVKLDWTAIQQVIVLPSRLGQSVQVISQEGRFSFKTMGEVAFQGEVRGRTGFADGQDILNHIVNESGLKLADEVNNALYYTRV